MNRDEAGIELRRAWVSQLYQEHEHICWSYKVDLEKPLIEISESTRNWGSWDPDIRTIKLSSLLIEEHSWDIVIQVLKHEIAHQVVSDIFGSDDGHGPLFRRACEKLGIPEVFCRAGGDIPRQLRDFRREEGISENARILEKVRKLLSLAQSNNEHEAFLAMKKANQLIKKHNLQRIEQNGDATYVHAIIGHKKKRVENYQRSICLILQRYFFVEVVYSYLYDAHDGETYKTIELLGTVENVLMAEYVYYFLLNQLEILWKDHRSKNGRIDNRKKRSYWLGVLKGFSNRLAGLEKDRKHPDRPEDPDYRTTSALVCAQDIMLSQYMGMRFPRLQKIWPQSTSLDYGIYRDGLRDGARLTIHRGIAQQGGFQGKLIPIG